MSQWNKDIVSELVAQYSGRSKRLRRNATVTIMIIGALLITGITIFILAGEIVRKENTDAEIKAYFDRAEKTMLESQTKLTADIISEEAQMGKITDSAISDLKSAAQSLETTATIIKAMRQEPITYPEQTFNFISTATTRLGIVILLLFLVQILVPLYRYNTKLAAFYDARADALRLVSDDLDRFEHLVNVLSPDGVDFGKSPATPTQQAFELAKEVVTSQRKNS